jgi:hypothetical protein
LSVRLDQYYGRLRRPADQPPFPGSSPVIGTHAPTGLTLRSRRVGEGLPSSRHHLLNVPRPLRRGVPRGCTFRIFTASMAFTLKEWARLSLSRLAAAH